jgi:DNA-binding response OmpR family regulator
MTVGVVLIADPDAAARERYEVALSRAGFSAVSAADGTSAPRLANRLVPDHPQNTLASARPTRSAR